MSQTSRADSPGSGRLLAAILARRGRLPRSPSHPRWLVAPARAAFMQGLDALAAPLLAWFPFGDAERVLNTLLFVPLGATIALLLHRRLWPLAILVGFAISAAVEYAQLTIPGRVPDAADVVWNTVGAAIGVILVTVVRLVGRRSPPRSGGDGCRGRQGDAHLKAAFRARRHVERAVVRPHDRRHDREAQARAVVARPHAASGTANERLGQGRGQRRVDHRPGVADGEHRAGSLRAGRHLHPAAGTLWTIAFCRRFAASRLTSVGWPVTLAGASEASMRMPRAAASVSTSSIASATIAARSTGSLSSPASRPARASASSASVVAMARSLVAPMRSSSGVGIASGRVGLRDLDHGADDRVRRAQLVRGVRREATLLLEGALHAGEHRVERVGEVGELVPRPGEGDAVVEGTGRGPAGGVGDAIEGPQHDAREHPAADESEDDQQRERPPGVPDEHLDEIRAVRGESSADHLHVALRHEPQQQEADREQRDARRR